MTPQDFKNTEENILSHLHVVAEALCRRCEVGRGHHDGPIHKLLLPRPGVVNLDQVDAYFNNVHHGFFHGICAYIAGALATGRELDEWFISSILLHDFVKTIDGDPETHDSALQAVYPNLRPVTYCHRKPREEHVLNPLVVGDREELFRFSDASEWVDADWPHRKARKNREQLTTFYSRIRPALEKVFLHRNAVWIRHGLEFKYLSESEVSKLDHGINEWPVGHFGSDHYAIELDKPPFTICADHGRINTWRQVQGFVPMLKPDGNIDFGDRDHLWRNAKLGIGDWVFFLHDAPEHLERYPFLRELPVCSFEVLRKMWLISHLLECKLKALC